MYPKISIIIPIYNAEKYLKDCLNSIVNQSLHEIEIICVLNGCTDSSLYIIENYAQKDQRITVIEKKTADLGKARNTGVKAAKGEYLMFVDADDWIELEACEKLYKIVKTNNLDILQGRYQHVPNMLFKHFKCKKHLHNKKLTGPDFWKQNQNVTMVNWDKIWKRSFFIENTLFNSEGIYFEDCITSLKGYTFAQSFMYTDYEFYFHQRVATSITNAKTSQKHIDSSEGKLKAIESFITEYKLQGNDQIMGNFFIHLFVHFALYKPDCLEELKDKIKEIKISALTSSPLRIKLAYSHPGLAAAVYPVWRRRATVNYAVFKLIKDLNRS